MSEYWIITSGNGLLDEGRKVGYIDAKSPENAEDALIRSGQIPPRCAGHFALEFKGAA